MLIGRASVIRLWRGSVFLGTEPTAIIQCGSRWSRSTYSSDPALNHSARTSTITAKTSTITSCARRRSLSSQLGWIRRKMMGRTGSPFFATVNRPSRMDSSSAHIDPRYQYQKGAVCCNPSLARPVLKIFKLTRHPSPPSTTGSRNRLSIKSRPGLKRALGHACTKRNEAILSPAKDMTTAAQCPSHVPPLWPSPPWLKGLGRGVAG